MNEQDAEELDGALEPHTPGPIDWHSVADVFRQEGFDFPDYQAAGVAFLGGRKGDSLFAPLAYQRGVDLAKWISEQTGREQRFSGESTGSGCLAGFFYLGASLVAFVLFKSGGFDVGCIGVFIAFSMFIVLLAIGNFIRDSVEKDRQEKLDARAKEVVEKVLRGEEPGAPLILYLRPFAITSRLPQHNPKYTFMPLLPSAYTQREFNDFESVLLHAGSRFGCFLAIGEPGEIIGGAARIESSEKEWKKLIEALAPNADIIFAVPAYSEGTLWEMRFLKEQDLLSKTVFVWPPTDS